MKKYTKITFDETNKIKLMNANFIKLSLKIIKNYEWKSRGWALYKIENKYFFTGQLHINPTLFLENSMEIYLYLQVKPFIIDEIFWKIFDIEENKKKPVGLRANGDFVIKGPYLLFGEKLDYNKIEHTEKNWEKVIIDSINIMDNRVKQFLSEEWAIEKFNEYEEKTSRTGQNKKLIEILLLILAKRYEDAYKIASIEINENRISRYGGRKGDAYDYIKEYCKNKMS